LTVAPRDTEILAVDDQPDCASVSCPDGDRGVGAKGEPFVGAEFFFDLATAIDGDTRPDRPKR
jgi:hypothetical protein